MAKGKTATFAGGCFWCTEAVFKRLKGVERVIPGYSGGEMENPTYEHVSAGTTNHAEVVQIEFNPSVISYEELLDVFFATHDPTQLGRQGADVGTQYRSAIFFHDEGQRKLAEQKIRRLESSGDFGKPIVTEVTRFTTFYAAEDYHKDYYEKNKNAPYCRIVIDPKVNKLIKEFGDKVKS